MSDESEFDFGEDCLDDNDQGDCDYGYEFCVEPSLRSIGNCFECWLYQEDVGIAEEEEGEKEEIKQQVRNPT
jgi:hypothetical protein